MKTQPLVRTTIRLPKSLKQEIDTLSIEEGKSFQSLCQLALRKLLQSKAKTKATKLVFKTQSLGVSLDNLTRDDIYGDLENVS